MYIPTLAIGAPPNQLHCIAGHMDGKKVALFCIAGFLGSAFIGYCIYFDQKRRSDPDYKRKVLKSETWTYRVAFSLWGVANIIEAAKKISVQISKYIIQIIIIYWSLYGYIVNMLVW